MEQDGDSFARIVDFQNLHVAYRDARICKRYRSSILKFGYKLEENLLALRWELMHKTYKHGGYREFVVTDSKKRTIKAAPFRDRVVHHAVCNIIEPILDNGFIYDSYACRREKGTHAAIRRLEYFIKSLRSGLPATPRKPRLLSPAGEANGGQVGLRWLTGTRERDEMRRENPIRQPRSSSSNGAGLLPKMRHFQIFQQCGSRAASWNAPPENLGQ